MQFLRVRNTKSCSFLRQVACSVLPILTHSNDRGGNVEIFRHQTFTKSNLENQAINIDNVHKIRMFRFRQGLAIALFFPIVIVIIGIF